MQIRYIFINIWCYLIDKPKSRSISNLDGKCWIQNILLKNHLKSLNKSN